MNYKTYVALMVFAIDRDMLGMSLQTVMDSFTEWAIQHNESPQEVVDDIIAEAKESIKHNNTFGDYAEVILKCK